MLLFDTDSAEIELLYLFGGRRLLIIVGIALYLIAGAALLLFIPETYDWLRAEARYTVQATVVSNTPQHHAASDETEYKVTMEYEINGIRRTHSEYAKRQMSGKHKLHVYCTRDGRWEVMSVNLPGILLLTAGAAAAVLYGTTVLRAAKNRKQSKTGESA